MPKLPERQKYFIKGKEEITDPKAPVISDEFIDKRPEGDYQGQSIEVRSQTNLEDDRGTGETFIIRTYEFGANPETFRNGIPPTQNIFDSHMKGIAALLWQDGMTPVLEINPRIVFTEDRKKYLIMVTARPSLGQAVIDKPKTLTEIIHGHRQNSDSVQRSVPVPSIKKKKASRPIKAPK